MRIGLISLFLLLHVASFTGTVIAQNTNEIFYDEQTLGESAIDITKMDIDELSLFKKVLSECVDDFLGDKSFQHSCDVAWTSYDIEYGRGRSLDKLWDRYRFFIYSLTLPVPSRSANTTVEIFTRRTLVRKRLIPIALTRASPEGG